MLLYFSSSGGIPYWSESGPLATLPAKDIHIDEHSPHGKLIWDAKPVDPDGQKVTVTFKWVNLWSKRGCRGCLTVFEGKGKC